MYWKIIYLLIIFILVICIYYNLMRYFLLYITPCKSYINEYKSKSKMKTKSKIILSITTTPDRISRIHPMIKSLLHQTIKVDEIALNIPDACNNKKFKIPVYLKDIVNIYKCGRDYGEGTNYMPTLLREGDKNTIIILLKDNIIYGEDFVETLLLEHKKDDCCLYTDNAILIKPQFVHHDILDFTKTYLDDDTLIRFVKVPKKKVNYSGDYKNILVF